MRRPPPRRPPPPRSRLVRRDDRVWCVGDCDAVGCAICEQRSAQGGSMCPTGDVCCAENGNAICKAKCQ